MKGLLHHENEIIELAKIFVKERLYGIDIR